MHRQSEPRAGNHQASTREPADADWHGVSLLDPALVNGKRVDFHLFDMAGSVGADVMSLLVSYQGCWIRCYEDMQR